MLAVIQYHVMSSLQQFFTVSCPTPCVRCPPQVHKHIRCLDSWRLLQDSPEKVHIAKFEDDLVECVLRETEILNRYVLIVVLDTPDSKTKCSLIVIDLGFH